MDPDDHVCLCFRVSLRKIRNYMARENPPVASLISDCLGAGTGCQWCVPFLCHLHAQHQRGETPDLRISPQAYAESRLTYRETGRRPTEDAPPEADGPDAQ
ncbi:MAG: (2Fe-2S)-binding protein [Phycisphaerales bacterium]|nr:(2Fe-2S)-binding protein [Phycisphaerales bacterium]